jgi:hypothetical protein
VVSLTPQFSAGGWGVRAAGVSMNSKSSEESEWDFDMLSAIQGGEEEEEWTQAGRDFLHMKRRQSDASHARYRSAKHLTLPI